jgi:molybdopterin biosynthesis enzyme
MIAAISEKRVWLIPGKPAAARIGGIRFVRAFVLLSL